MFDECMFSIPRQVTSKLRVVRLRAEKQKGKIAPLTAEIDNLNRENDTLTVSQLRRRTS